MLPLNSLPIFKRRRRRRRRRHKDHPRRNARNTRPEMAETDQGSLGRCRTSLGSQRRVRGNWTAFDLSTTCTDGVVKTSWKWLAQYDPYYGGSGQTRWPLARRPRSAREEGCSIGGWWVGRRGPSWNKLSATSNPWAKWTVLKREHLTPLSSARRRRWNSG